MSLFSRLVVTTLPVVPKFVVGKVASRYVAGETLDDALATVRQLAGEGAVATIDVLGEEVKARDKALWAVEEYSKVYRAIQANRLDANVSVKLTMLGLKIDEGFCGENLLHLAGVAKECGNFLRVDMEDRSTTDATLRLVRATHARCGNVGPVLQAYMRRTLQDIAELPADTPSVRLCKGIYIEPRTAAWKGHDTVRRNYLHALEALFRRGFYVGIATHDEYLVCGALGMIDRLGLARDRYEFQMLHGVDPELRRVLLDGGHRLRVYVPFGRDWYPYSMRRLRENPEVARHVARAMLGVRPG